MTLLTNCEISPPSDDKTVLQAKAEDDCLICRLMRIRHERSDVVQWLLSTDKSLSEKTKIATLLSGIKIDEEIIECLEDPSIRLLVSR